VPDLARRSRETELLDAGVPAEEARLSLADLRFVNRWLGDWRALRGAVTPLLAGQSAPRVLDVGSGSAQLASLLRGVLRNAIVVAVDLKPLHLAEAPSSLHRVAGDARRLPFAAFSFDVVMASLFLHHFDDEELPSVLRCLFGQARRALVVNDLRRARVPHVFGQLAFPLLFRSRVSVHDGLVSIRRGFTPDELRKAFSDAGIRDVAIRRRFPYRLVAVARRP
jgi:SAM-dependent methyltransferase